MAAPTQRLDLASRSCGTCSLCCKLLEITELNKPRGVWCPNCKPGAGCMFYADKPGECGNFSCAYLANPDLDEQWKPDHARIVVYRDLNGKRIAVNVDPQRPDAWRKEPYYSKLKQWAKSGAQRHIFVVVSVGWRMHAVFPDRDVDLGVLGEDERIVTIERETPVGLQWEAFRMRKDDPRAKDFGLTIDEGCGHYTSGLDA